LIRPHAETPQECYGALTVRIWFATYQKCTCTCEFPVPAVAIGGIWQRGEDPAGNLRSRGGEPPISRSSGSVSLSALDRNWNSDGNGYAEGCAFLPPGSTQVHELNCTRSGASVACNRARSSRKAVPGERRIHNQPLVRRVAYRLRDLPGRPERRGSNRVKVRRLPAALPVPQTIAVIVAAARGV